MFSCASSYGGLVRYQIQFRGQDRADSTFKAVFSQRTPYFGCFEDFGPDERDLDAVETVPLDFRQQLELFRAEIDGPQERIDAEFHA